MQLINKKNEKKISHKNIIINFIDFFSCQNKIFLMENFN